MLGGFQEVPSLVGTKTEVDLTWLAFCLPFGEKQPLHQIAHRESRFLQQA